MRRNVRRGLFLAVALAAVALVALALRAPPRLVEPASVDRGPVEVVIREEGRTYVDERYVISSPVTAYRPRIPWHVGDGVSSGELLLQLQPAPSEVLDPRSRATAEAEVARAQAALQAAQTNADSAHARLEFAEREYRRLKALFEEGDIPRRTLDEAQYALDDARAHLRSAEFTIDVARHELDAARTRVDYSSDGTESESVPIRAPTDGVVLGVPEQSEGVVQPGTPLLAIGDPASLEVHVDLLTTEAVKLEPGMPVRIIEWGGADGLQGHVRRVEPSAFTKISALGVEEQRTRVIVDFDSPRDQWQRLGDAFRVDAEFLLWRSDDVVRVPAGALFREGNRWMAFRINEGRAYATPVEPGHRGEDYVEIIDGLAPGERVVLYPGNELADGMRVRSQEAVKASGGRP